ncbi:hypothetical protein ACIBCD_37355 [Nocardia brasiliensis]|uniref:hypothetical protein n=1 Tax=Nocardia brasiliensis TaxID=37326 RepID=UPI0037A7FA0E
MIIAGVVGVVAVVLGAGVGIGIAVGGKDGESVAVATVSSAPVRPSAAATTTPPPEPAPGNYAMSKAANACDLVDSSVLHQWSSTPDQPPAHHETQPSAYGPGSLTCQVSYKSPAGDGVHWNQAAIDLRVEFTTAGAAPAYDEWKRKDTGTTGSGLNSGDVPGIGAQGYWHTAVADSSSTTGMDYVVGVQDSNVSVRVRIPILRQHGEPPVHLDEVAPSPETRPSGHWTHCGSSATSRLWTTVDPTGAAVVPATLPLIKARALIVLADA